MWDLLWSFFRSGSSSPLRWRCGIVDAREQVIAVRDSKAPHGPAVLFDRGALSAFVGAVKARVL
ncbi:DUF397 domain-containing protein [Streptomyces sp. NBC_01014]|uniref:DUF397 domain-containing protein n=1 Tax=Streptomyces sp. NBC_01014 TaxID=2903719 RepID=UPI00386EFE85